MATIDGAQEKLWCDKEHHPLWIKNFSEHQRQKQIDQDLEAGYEIPGILTAVMVFGFLSMVVSVWLAI